MERISAVGQGLVHELLQSRRVALARHCQELINNQKPAVARSMVQSGVCLLVFGIRLQRTMRERKVRRRSQN